MFARVSTYELEEGRAVEVVGAFGPALEDIRGLDGFVDGYLLVERDGGHAVSVTLWESIDAIERSRVAATKARMEAANQSGATVTSTYEYEVGIHAVPTAAGSPAQAL